jgi:glycine cleavage system H protein
MNNIPNELKYTKTHEWVQTGDDGNLTIGISDHAQDLLGDIVYIELPEVGRALNAGDDCGVVESVKAASDFYSPVAGEIITVNEALIDTPELVNQDAYGEGWIYRIKPEGEPSDLLDGDAYQALIDSETL